MDQSGEHRITSVKPPRKSDPGSCWTGCGGVIVFILLLLVLQTCKEKSGPQISPGPTPQPPTPPASRAARFEAASGAPTPIAVVLGGGSYEITYETASDITMPVTQTDRDDAFFADFSTGRTVGNLERAKVIILFGALKLDIYDLRESDRMRADVLNQDKNVRAYFHFAESPRGPPSDGTTQPSVMKRKKVIIVGTLESIHFPARHQNSELETYILDLDPTSNDREIYEERVRRYQRDVERYREREQMRKYEQRARENHPREFHPL